MLFNSHLFLFLFLPACLLAVAVARRFGLGPAIWTLTGASLIFYGWHYPPYVALLLASVVGNWLVGRQLERRPAKWMLALGVGANIAVLGGYKYLDLMIGTANAVAGTDWALTNVALPLAISFFTFIQIAFLVDVYRRVAPAGGFGDYLLFVSFFPHLIAGPIVHHRDLTPQFRRPQFGRPTAEAVGMGLAWVAVGLVKKTLIADQMAPIADRLFAMAEGGGTPSLIEAWIGALAFTFQIYFDFSGYCDMAIGLALMLGVMLPLNFNAPYRATSIIEFWRRWHITLSHFLRDYLYIALGGNRRGEGRRWANLLLTMVLGGLWHGASWTFAAWGALHGLFLAVNHAWRHHGLPMWRPIGWLLTMVAVVAAWVLFRAESFDAALRILEGMAGLNGVVLAADHQPLLGPLGSWLQQAGLVQFQGTPLVSLSHLLLLPLLILFCLLAPTTQSLMGYGTIGTPRWWQWRWAGWQSVAAGLLLAAGTVGIGQASQFIYFQF